MKRDLFNIAALLSFVLYMATLGLKLHSRGKFIVHEWKPFTVLCESQGVAIALNGGGDWFVVMRFRTLEPLLAVLPAAWFLVNAIRKPEEVKGFEVVPKKEGE